MTDPLDTNKIAAELIVHATEKTIARASKPLKDTLRRLIHVISDAYKPFLEKTFIRVSKIRTFLKPSESIDLLDQYVPVNLTDKEAMFSVDEIVARLANGHQLIVSGLAGRGKSVLMKYIALSFYHNPQGRIPIFLELRYLNKLTDRSFLQYIHSQYKGETNITFADFMEAVKSGYFVLILDGFDEISPEHRNDLESQILEFSNELPSCPIVVSGRPYENFSSWEHFSLYHLQTMTLEQTRTLIQNSRYNDESKSLFLKKLTADFFNQHESFLNTPLLAIMMMISFDENAKIPASLHEFYRNAFDTLARRHDAMKAQFLRRTHSGCSADEMRRIFSSFCIQTYMKSRFSFEREEALTFVQKSIKQQLITAKPQAVLSDLIESFCLLQQECFEISFVHRSFQEYFCALFLSMSPAGILSRYLDEGTVRIYDDVIPMLFAIVPERVESEWANDKVKSLIDTYIHSEFDNNVVISRDMYPKITIDNHGESISIVLHDSELSRDISILSRIYSAHFNGKRRARPSNRKHREIWNSSVKQEILELKASGDAQFQQVQEVTRRGRLRLETPSPIAVVLTERHDDLVRAMYADDIGGSTIFALRAVATDQRKRIKSEDKFLKDMFG